MLFFSLKRCLKPGQPIVFLYNWRGKEPKAWKEFLKVSVFLRQLRFRQEHRVSQLHLLPGEAWDWKGAPAWEATPDKGYAGKAEPI